MQKNDVNDLDDTFDNDKSETEYVSVEIWDDQDSVAEQAGEDWNETLEIEREKEETVEITKEDNNEQPTEN